MDGISAELFSDKRSFVDLLNDGADPITKSKNPSRRRCVRAKYVIWSAKPQEIPIYRETDSV